MSSLLSSPHHYRFREAPSLRSRVAPRSSTEVSCSAFSRNDMTAPKPKRPIPRVPRGLRDIFADDIAARRRMIGVIREVYERYGFEPLETPAIEFVAARVVPMSVRRAKLPRERESYGRMLLSSFILLEGGFSIHVPCKRRRVKRTVFIGAFWPLNARTEIPPGYVELSVRS